MINLKYIIENGPNNSNVVYMTVSRVFNNAKSASETNLSENTKTILQSFVRCSDDRSGDVWISIPISYVNKEERTYRRLLNEKSDLQKKKSNIENRLIEIQNDLNERREEIRSGRR